MRATRSVPRSARKYLLAAAFSLHALGCSSSTVPSLADSGTPDAGAADSGTPDAGATDAGTDAGVADAGVPQLTFTIDNTASTPPASQLNVGVDQLFGVDGAATSDGTAQARLNTLAPNLIRLHIQAVAGNLPTSAQTIQICPTPSDTSCNRIPWDFTKLDYLVNDARAAGATPLMNIALPPPWQWTITDATTTPRPTGYVTDADDPNHPFAAFASYMSSLVEYYNSGQTTVTEMDGSSHTLVNPQGTANHITYWELLNEPSIVSTANFYQPVGSNSIYQATFTSAAYISMWNATTAAMLAADPTVQIIGPALPFVIGGDMSYIPMLLQQTNKPAAISFHGYAWSNNETSDLAGFSGTPGVATSKGLAGVLADLHQVQAFTAAAGMPLLPIWIDEFGLNGFGLTDPSGRPTHSYGAVYNAAAFSLLSTEPALAQMDDFSFYLPTYPDLSMLNPGAENQPVLTYWLYRELGRRFPAGSEQLAVQSSAGAFSLAAPSVIAYAVRSPADGSVAVMLANATVASSGDQGGHGEPTSAVVTVNGGSFASATVELIDATTDLNAGPAETPVPAGGSAVVNLAGYGVAIIRFAP